MLNTVLRNEQSYQTLLSSAFHALLLVKVEYFVATLLQCSERRLPRLKLGLGTA